MNFDQAFQQVDGFSTVNEEPSAYNKEETHNNDAGIELINKEELNKKTTEESNSQGNLLFTLNDEIKQQDNEEEVDDLTELPIERALKLNKKRKNYIKTYTTKLPDILEVQDEVPAFKKKGIDVDLSPKSSENVHKIEIDMDGNFKLKDGNSFLYDNVD